MISTAFQSVTRLVVFTQKRQITMSYKYIDPTSKFTKEQKDFYEKNGFILIKNNVSHELLDKCRQRFMDIVDGKKEMTGLDKLIVIKDPVLRERGAKGEYLVNKLQDFTHDEVLGDYCACKSVIDVVEDIIGPNITAAHSMLINKPPDSHPDISKHPMHQDLFYFPFRPPHRIVAAWTAMERTFVDNGCLFVVPGSHNFPFYEHRYPKQNKHGLYFGIEGKENLPKVDLIMEKGDTVFFHPLLLHGSYPNKTKHFRKAISCHYADTNCNFINVENTLQGELAKEVEAVVVKKTNVKIPFSDFWKLKSRLVRGPPGEFQRFDNHL